MRTRHRFAFVLSAALQIGCAEQPAPTAESSVQPSLAASSSSCAQRVNNTVEKLLECVTLDRVRAHQAALQAVANSNNGTRVAGTAGYSQSVDYVAGQLRSAGYNVTVQAFPFRAFFTLSATLLEQTAPVAGAVAATILTYSGSGDVAATVSKPTGLGCVASDFAGFPAGHIALIPRGTCTFATKAINAVNAGATGVVIYNSVALELSGTLGDGFLPDLPVVGVSLTVGQTLAATPGLVMHLRTSTSRPVTSTSNVIAETADGDPNNVVMLGAHLDAVSAGPGINDNGSGSAAILETALQMAKVKPRNKVRFAWWGAEEAGLLGSRYYVNTLPANQLNRLALYLNFDMIGSPNYGFFVYDGDDSDGVGVGPYPQGSGAIEGVFASFYTARGVPFQGVDIFGSSDHTPFIDAGVPSGGLFTGASGGKSAGQAALWGGTAGQPFDPCYHQACDTFDNVNLFALEVNADAVAYAALTFAMNTSLVNGIKGKGNFKANTSASSSHVHAGEQQ